MNEEFIFKDETKFDKEHNEARDVNFKMLLSNYSGVVVSQRIKTTLVGCSLTYEQVKNLKKAIDEYLEND